MEPGGANTTPPYGPAPGLVPPWFDELPLPAWFVSERGWPSRPNPAARGLLDLDQGPCHRCLGAKDPRGAPFCGPACRPLAGLRGGRAPSPLVFLQGPGDAPMYLATVTVEPRRWLLHVAVPLAAFVDWEGYLAQLAGRTGGPTRAVRDADGLGRLTPREREVLEGLARDRTTDQLAGELGIHPTTARNHVQHILAKLGAHSIGEAVGRYLLARVAEELGRARPRGGS